MEQLNDDFDRVNEFGSPLCTGERKDGTLCPAHGVVAGPRGLQCLAHGWTTHRARLLANVRKAEPS